MNDRPATGSVGARLKTVRESQRVTLRQLANTTKIAVPALDAIERDDVKKLPGGLFARSFVRAYARELGLDVEQTVAEFFAQFPEPVDGSMAPAAGHWPAGRRTLLAPGVLQAAALAVPAVALVVWIVFGLMRTPVPSRPRPLTAERIAAARPDVPAPMPVRPAHDVVPAGGAIPAAGRDVPAAALTLHLTARSACWVSIFADGREVVSRLMGVGEEQAVRAASELRIKVGDAGAVGLRLNGAPVRPLGAAGQVVTLRVDSSNVAGLLQH